MIGNEEHSIRHPLLTADDVAHDLGVSLSTVRRWIRRGSLRGVRVGGQWRFSKLELERALISGELGRTHESKPLLQHRAPTAALASQLPSWAQHNVFKWRQFVQLLLRRIKPDHVVVLDRRGARMFMVLGPWEFEWGTNLWRSMVLKWLSPTELKDLFSGKVVLLFDEMIRHGRNMQQLRAELEQIGATVFSAALIRSRSHFDQGTLHDTSVIVSEDLDERNFGIRAGDLARILKLVRPPLDVDHLVVQGSLKKTWASEDFLRTLSRLGTPFVVEESSQEPPFISVTLDRPQFFDASRFRIPKGLKASWEGPCKVRFYIYPQSEECDCSFIAMPNITGPLDAWEAAARDWLGEYRSDVPIAGDRARQVFIVVSYLASLELLRQFVEAVLLIDVGVHLNRSETAINEKLMAATYGLRVGRRLADLVKSVLTTTPMSRINSSEAPVRVPLVLRPFVTKISADRSRLDARRDFLSHVPRKFPDDRGTEHPGTPVTYGSIVDALPEYPEVILSHALDVEIDVGTLKPDVNVTVAGDGMGASTKLHAERAYWRGEYFGFADWDQEVLTDEDLAIRRTLGIAHHLLSRFMSLTHRNVIQAMRFTKLFSNFVLDWQLWEESPLYLSTRPEKYGLVPTVPHTGFGERHFDALARFLVQQKCIIPVEISKGIRQWSVFGLPENSEVDWSRVYNMTNDGLSRSMVTGLVRLYVAIQENCKPLRPSRGEGKQITEYSNALTVLGSVRNKKVAYVCCHYEISQWIKQGRQYLFPALRNIVAALGTSWQQPFLFEDLKPGSTIIHDECSRFAEPATQLEIKLEMYRHLSHLRQQIAELCEAQNLDFGEVVLQSIDTEPQFDDRGSYPTANLEIAVAIIRPFSSMLRQVLTSCGLDRDTRKDHKRRDSDTEQMKDAEYYLEKWLKACPELHYLTQKMRSACNLSKRGQLTEEMVKLLQVAFDDISSFLQREEFLPAPPTSSKNEVDRALSAAFLDLAMKATLSGMGVTIVIEYRNITNLAHLIVEHSGRTLSFDDALDTLIDNVIKQAADVAQHYPGVHYLGVDGDTLVLTVRNADEAVQFASEFQRQCVRAFANWDRTQLCALALTVVGMSWYEPGRGAAFEGRMPAIAAYTLADKCGFMPGTIAITGAVAAQLSGQTTTVFVEWGSLAAEEQRVYQGRARDIGLGQFDQDGVRVSQVRQAILDSYERLK